MTKSLKKIEQTLLQMSRAERRQFVDWFFQHEARIMEAEEADNPVDDLSEAQRAELIHRRHLAEAHPESLEHWGDAITHIHQQFQSPRSPNPPAS